MILNNVQTGKDELVADPQNALAQGTHVGVPGQPYNYINPDTGAIFQAPGQDIRDVVTAGGVLETAEMAKQREERAIAENYPGTAAAAGAGRGLTFGGTDFVLKEMGLGDAARAVKEANPTASVLGEVGGIIIPTLLSGGAGLVGRGAKGASALTHVVSEGAGEAGAAAIEALGGASHYTNAAGQIVRTIPAKLTGSVIEGATYGLGKALSEESLGEPSHVAENILLGGLLGGAGTLVIEGGLAAGKAVIEKGVPLAAKLITDTPLSEIRAMMEISEKGAAKRAATFKGPKVEKPNFTIDDSDIKRRIIDSARILNETIATAGEQFRNVKYAVAEEAIPGPVTQMMKDEASTLVSKAEDILQTMDAQPSVYSVSKARKFDQAIRDYSNAAFGSEVGGTTGVETGAELFKITDEFKNTLRAIKAGGAPGPEKEAAILVGGLWKDAHSLLEKPAVWGEAATAQKALNEAYTSVINKDYGTAKPFAKYFGRMRADGTIEIDPSKVLRWAKKVGTPEGMAADEAFQAHMESVRNLREVLAKHGTDAAGISRMEAAAGAEAKLTGEVQNFKGMKSALDQAAKEWEAKQPAAFGEVNTNKFLGLGLISRTAAAASRTALLAPRLLAEVEHALNGVNREWMSTVGKVFDFLESGKIGGAALNVVKPTQSKEEARQVMDVVSDQAKTMAAINSAPGALQYAAPQISSAIQQQTAQAAAFLGTKVPQQPGYDEYGIPKKWSPSDAELAKFQRYYDALNRPQVILQDLMAGRLTPETVEAVRTVYPNYYQKTTQAVAQYLAEKQPELTGPVRQQLNILFQRGMANNQRAADLQRSFQPPSQAGPGRPSKIPDSFGQSLRTAGQNTEVRRAK